MNTYEGRVCGQTKRTKDHHTRHTNVLTGENWKLQTKAGKLWSQTEATYKQVNNLSTELTCFKELQKQEQLAASYRVNNLRDEVNKQKTLESQLQRRYGDLLAESERLQNLLEEHKRKVAAESKDVGPTEGVEEMKVDDKEASGVENDASQKSGVENDTSQVPAASGLEEMKIDNEEVSGVENDSSQKSGVEDDASQVPAASEAIAEDTVINKNDKLTAEMIAPQKDAENTMDGPVSDAADAGIATGAGPDTV